MLYPMLDLRMGPVSDPLHPTPPFRFASQGAAVPNQPLSLVREETGAGIGQGGEAMVGQTEWTEEKVVERAEFVGRTVKELCQLLRAGGEYRDVVEQIARARGALESIRIVVWRRELARTAYAGRRGAV